MVLGMADSHRWYQNSWTYVDTWWARVQGWVGARVVSARVVSARVGDCKGGECKGGECDVYVRSCAVGDGRYRRH
jgi:hypothetical protein